MIHTIGIDIGSGAIKSVLFRHEGNGRPEWLAKRCERIRSRDPMTLARQGYEGVHNSAERINAPRYCFGNAGGT